MQIGDKMFTYIQNHSNLTPSMINEYKNSMIFIGDQKQIYVPVINSYVGLGVDAYSYILDKFNNNEADLLDLLNHINKNNVTSIFAQYSEKDFANKADGPYYIPYPDVVADPQHNNDRDHELYVEVHGGSINSSVIESLKAKRNVVIRGIHDEDVLLNSSNTNSGINVTIHHDGVLSQGEDGKYSYSYHDPEHDIILIDDSKTWDHIAYLNTYMIDFTTKFATQQANRIYKNIIGEGDDPVYIEKEFDEAFISYQTGLKSIENVYVKDVNNHYYPIYVGSEIDSSNSSFTTNDQINDPDSNHPNPSYIYVYNNINNTYSPIYTYNTDPNVPREYSYIDVVNIAFDTSNGGLEYIKGSQSFTPVWYQKDDAITSTYNMNISDGIQTIKEVAYILDVITNGDMNDTAISLSYNIAQNWQDIQELKKFQSGIVESAVTSVEGNSSNEYLTMTYYSKELWGNGDSPAKGGVAIDLGLVLAQTYVANGSTYAAYLSNHVNNINIQKYYYTLKDPTNYNNYYHASILNDSESELYKMLQEYFNAADDSAVSNIAVRVANRTVDQDTGKVSYSIQGTDNIIIQNIRNEDRYIYWDKHRVFNFNNVQTKEILPTKGLTTVDWVTTYVGWAAENIINRVNNVNAATSEAINNAITSLYAYTGDAYGHDTSYSDQTNVGLFVSHVTEHNGIIEVHKKKLPLDNIISSTTFTPGITINNSNEGHILCSIEPEFVSKYKSTNSYNFYEVDSNGNIIRQILSNVDTIDLNSNYKIDCGQISAFNIVPTNNTINDIIVNLGKVSYFYKESIKNSSNQEAVNYDQYIPLDPQIAYSDTSLGLFDANGNVIENKIYYSTSSSFNQNYYLRTITHHNEDGSTSTSINAYISYLATASKTSTGFADAWDVRRTIESMFTWVDITTNKIIE